MASVIAGVAALNGIFVAVGYALLAPTLKRLSLSVWPAFAGLAMLVGAGVVGVTLSVLAVLGLRTGVATCVAVAGALTAAGGLAAAFLPQRRLELFRFRTITRGRVGLGATFAAAAATAVVGICALTIIAAFRSSPWLNDAWTFWLPKGISLSGHGLDARLFAETGRYDVFANPDYPLWWSVVGGLLMDFVGRVDLRALNAEIAILLAAFVAAIARLLWGRVRPWILWTSLLLLLVSPELLRQTQSGGADVPLAVYLALAVLTAGLWLGAGEGFFLALAAVASAAAANLKLEGAPQLALLVVLPALLLWRVLRGRSAVLLVGLAAGAATSVPWVVWRALHDVRSDFSVRDGLDPGYLADHAERIWPSAHAVASNLVGRDWPLIVPVLLLLTILAVILERRPLWVVPAATFAACFVFWVWTYWAGSIPLDFWLPTSAYRVVDGVLLAAAVAIPLMAERLTTVVTAGRGESP